MSEAQVKRYAQSLRRLTFFRQHEQIGLLIAMYLDIFSGLTRYKKKILTPHSPPGRTMGYNCLLEKTGNS